MQAFLEEKREQIAELCRTHHVRTLSVFGSAARDDFDSSHSDVDLLVDFDYRASQGYADNLFSLEQQLVRLLDRDVDLITEKYIRNVLLEKAIDRDKELLYAA